LRFFSRNLRRSGHTPDEGGKDSSTQLVMTVDRPALEPVPAAPSVAPQMCPYCARAIDPPPARNRRCPSCRGPIVVRRLDGRSVLLTTEAVVIFKRERQRVAEELRWTSERAEWLRLAATVNADPVRAAKLADEGISAGVVDDSRALYLAAAEVAVRKSRVAKRWPNVSRIRRQQATALFNAAGKPVPPPDAIAEIRREAMIAELRALAVHYKAAELISKGCCRTCRADDGHVFPIAAELRTRRLPHAGCSKGLCACDWWLAIPGPKKRRRARKKAQTPNQVIAADGDERTALDTDVDTPRVFPSTTS
jgi:hypothetical protein